MGGPGRGACRGAGGTGPEPVGGLRHAVQHDGGGPAGDLAALWRRCGGSVMPPVAHGDLVTDRRPTGLSLPQRNAAVVECDPVRGVRNRKQNAIAAKPPAGAGPVPGRCQGHSRAARW